jgi:hypothetical protein
MKFNVGNLFKALPALVVAAENIYNDEKSGSQKKVSIMSMIGIAADDAVKAVPAVLNPTQTTVAQAVSAEIDDIVSGYNQAGWPGAVTVGAIETPAVVGEAKAA